MRRDVLTVGSMFSGIGLLDYGLHRAGLQHLWFAEADLYRRSILAQRWPGALVLDDVRAVRADAVPHVDVIAGGFPCKGASTAGKRTGFDHPETVLWHEMARAVGELRPCYVLVENVANLLAVRDGAVWGEVLGRLAALGFDVEWDCLPAAAFGAPHLRDRMFAIAAHPGRARLEGAGIRRPAPDDDAAHADAFGDGVRTQPEPVAGCGVATFARRHDPAPSRRDVAFEWGDFEPAVRRWQNVVGPAPEPLVRRMDDGRARRVERSQLSALGDGVLVHASELCGRWIVNDAER